MTLTVACCQVSLRIGDAEGNRRRIDAGVKEAARAGAQLVVLPELSSSGYAFHDEAEVRALAEGIEGRTVSGWVELARRHQLVIAGGWCEADEAERLFNSAVLVDPSGVRARYRKAHLWDREKLFFRPGDDPPPVVETTVGRLGLMICYDLEFPEWVRLPALAGAELLCVPTNWPRLPRPGGERAMEVVRVQASAAVNRMFIAVCDRSGAERDNRWVEGTVIVDCDGWPMAGPAYERDADADRPIMAAIDLSHAGHKQISDHNDVHADRRPDLYAPVAGASASRGSRSAAR